MKRQKQEPLPLVGEAIIGFDKYQVERWRGHLPTIAPMIEEMSRATATATKQFGSYSNLVVTNIYGRAALTFLLYKDSFHIWDYVEKWSLGEYGDIPDVNDILDHLERGEFYCDNCKSWKSKQHAKRYDFAGVVCDTCYDPKKHLPPDTRGD